MARGALDMAIKAGVGYLAYKLARGGTFGPQVQQAALQIGATLGGGLGGVASPQPLPVAHVGTGSGGTVPLAPARGAIGQTPCDTTFVPGVHYVGPYGSGWVVVVNGQYVNAPDDQPIWHDLDMAQRAYNRARCPGVYA